LSGVVRRKGKESKSVAVVIRWGGKKARIINEPKRKESGSRAEILEKRQGRCRSSMKQRGKRGVCASSTKEGDKGRNWSQVKAN